MAAQGIPMHRSTNGKGVKVTQSTHGGIAVAVTTGLGAPFIEAPGGIPVVFTSGGAAVPVLGPLTLSGTLTNGTASSGTINGATTGSTITSNITGLTVNSGARTYSWDGTGAAGTTANGLVETLAGATGSPKNSSVTVAAAAPAVIGGITVGTAGGSGTYADSLKLIDGDDFTALPTYMSMAAKTNGYSSSPIHTGFRGTLVGGDVAMYIDPNYQGARSESSTALGFTRASVSSSVLNLTASAPDASELPYLPTSYYGATADANRKPLLLSGALRTGMRTMFSADGDWAYEGYVRFPSGVAKGDWPSFWSTAQNWPDFQEMDLTEITRNSTTGVPGGGTGVNGSTTDAGANVSSSMGASRSYSTSRFTRIVVRKTNFVANGASFTGTNGSATTASNTFTTATITSGTPAVGQVLSITGVAAGTTITGVTGTAPNYTITMSATGTISAAAALDGAGASLTYYDDLAVAGTLAAVYTYTKARVSRFRGGHDIRIDHAVANTWDGTTYDATNWPKGFEVDWWRLWTPASQPDRTDVVWLADTNVSPGGVWDSTFPSQATMFGSAPDREEYYGVFDNFDTPGMTTRNSRRPGGMVIDTAARTVTGTVPPNEGGRVGLAFIATSFSGGPARIVVKPYCVAPAVQSLPNKNVAYSGAFSIDVPYSAFHSGNLGPHTYTASSDKVWAVVTGNGTGAINVAGTAPGTADMATITITATNSIGQVSSPAKMRVNAISALTFIDSWTTLRAYWDAEDNTTVFSDVAGTTQAVAGSSSAKRVLDKIGSADLTEATAPPTYITDALASKKAFKFTASSLQRLSTLNRGSFALADERNRAFTMIIALRRGTPATSVNFAGFWRNNGQKDTLRLSISGGNAPFFYRYVNGGTGTQATASNLLSSDAWYILAIAFDGATVTVRRNGNNLGPNAVAWASNLLRLNGFSLGLLWDGSASSGLGAWESTGAFDGAIGAVMLAEQGAFDSNTAAAETMLAARYGVTLTP